MALLRQVGLGRPMTRAEFDENMNEFPNKFATIAALKAATWLQVGQVVAVEEYHAGIGGGMLFGRIVAGGTGTDDGGSYIDLAASGLQFEQNFGAEILIEQFGARGISDSLAIQSCINYLGKTGKIKTKLSALDIDQNITITEKGRPDVGVFEVDLSTAICSGSGGIIIDSCKNLDISINHPNQNLSLRGCWYSRFRDCRFSDLILNDFAATTFDDSYWNRFDGGVLQRIVKQGAASTNEFNFYGTALRGNVGQGFSSTKNESFLLSGSGNMQAWKFFGGDISYPQVEVITSTLTGDLELDFYGVYFDSHVPKLNGLANQRVSTHDCHIAGKTVGGTSFNQSIRGGSEFNGKVASIGWQPYQPSNLIPNGDMSLKLNGYTSSYGGPIGAFLGTISPVSDPVIGLYLNLSVGNGDASQTLCRFRSSVLEISGKYTGCLIARSNSGSPRSLNFAVGAQFFDAEVGTEWTVITLSAQNELSAGSTSDILMRSTDGLGYDVDVRYAGLALGTHPPLMCPQHHKIFGANRVRAGNIELLDGVSEPTTLTGGAALYIDVADGDLKIKFADGTIKTIVLDT